MPFNVSEFSSQINAVRGLAKPSKFYVQITPPLWYLNTFNGEIGLETLRFLCRNTNMPGINLNVTDYKSQGYAIADDMVTGISFSPLNLTFYADTDYRSYRFFHKWFQETINFQSNQLSGINSEYNGSLPYELSYKEDYETTVDIWLFDEMNQVMTLRMNKAFPIQVGDISLGWEMNNDIVTFPVEFRYSSYVLGPLDIETQPTNRPTVDVFSSLFSSGSGIVQSAINNNLNLGQFQNFIDQVTNLT